MRFPLHKTIALFLLLALPGCAGLAAMYSAPKYRSVGEDMTVPPGHVLVIGKIVLDPAVQQGPLNYVDVWDSKETVNFVVTTDLSRPVDHDAMIKIAPDELLFAGNGTTSFVPMPPGTRYLRHGSYAIYAVCSVYAIGPQGGCRAMDSEQLDLFENVRITVPADAAAVYVGTIVFEHDGANGTRTYVRDDFRTALAELDAMGIPGIDSRVVSKQLAEVVSQQVVSR